MYRFDIENRYIEAQRRRPTVDREVIRRAGAGDPRTPQGAVDARLPALETPHRHARGILACLVRLAVPLAQAPRAPGRRRAGLRRAGGRAPEERLPHHPTRRDDVPPAPRGGRLGRDRGGQPVPGTPRVLQVPRSGLPHPAARTAPRVPRGAPRRDHDVAPDAAGHVHAFARAARARDDRTGHRLAERSHRGRTPNDRNDHGANEAPFHPHSSTEGAHDMSTVRLAIVGVGNCASSLVQGIHYYKDAEPDSAVPGLMHVDLGGYHVGGVEVVAAFDVDAKKVGRDVSEAIYSEPNNTIRFADVPPTGVTVQRGPTLDGLGHYYRETIEESDATPVDIKSQVGATIVHRVLTKLFEDRGVKLNRTYQLNFGGNMDFMNMLERERLVSKKLSKTQSVQSQMRKQLDKHDIHIGPSDHVPWLEDRKWAQIRLEGQAFGDVPLNVELKLEVWDSPNSAGIVIDAVRCAKLALDRGVGGPLIGPSAYFMKSPPVQFSDDAAREMVEEFILGNGGSQHVDWTAFFDAHH